MVKAETRFICSPMNGVLIDADGKPAAGVTIRRKWLYNRKTGNDRVVTDAGGGFSFEGVVGPRKGFFSGLSTPVVAQHYFAELPTGDFEILYISSTSLERLHETGGRDFSITCDLRRDQGHGPFYWGVCSLE